MNNRQRHLRYKRSVYARRRARVIVWTAVAVLCVLLLLFLIIGNLLNNKVEEDRREEEARDTANPEQTPTLRTPPAIVGKPVYLVNSEGAPIGSLDSQTRNLSPSENALVLSLDSADGTLRYRSALAAALSTRPILSGGKDLGNLLSASNSRGFYISASLTLSECKEKDDLIRSAKLSWVASLVCEVIREGADDVLLLAPDATPEQIPELTALADTVHAILPDAMVGLSISEAILSSETCASHLDQLSGSFNFMALDRSELTVPDTAANSSWLLGTNQYYALRYRMRLIVPNVTGEQKTVLDTTLSQQAAGSWQYAYN